MLNFKAINEVFKKYPLCNGQIIQQRGMATEYCAMGALAKAVGATDAELRNDSGSGVHLFNNFHAELKERFGIESLEQYQTLMRANDGSRNSATRNKEVLNKVAEMSAEECIALFKDAELSSEQDSNIEMLKEAARKNISEAVGHDVEIEFAEGDGE